MGENQSNSAVLSKPEDEKRKTYSVTLDPKTKSALDAAWEKYGKPRRIKYAAFLEAGFLWFLADLEDDPSRAYAPVVESDPKEVTD